MKKFFNLVALVAISLLFVQCEQNSSSQGLGKHEGHEYVDLGLSVKWATCNVGAENPYDYGDYFSWGEVEPKDDYSWETYKYGKMYKELTKYCPKSDFGKDGFTDNKTILDPEDDAATVNWGGKWRMPTEAEQRELLANCIWSSITQNGVNGYKVTGPNGNSIFFPAAGYVTYSKYNNEGVEGYYLSSSFDAEYVYLACIIDFSSEDVTYNDRWCGYSVRPVCP